MTDEGMKVLKERYIIKFERKYITFALTLFNGNVTRAARYAKMDRSNFLRMMRKNQIRSVDFKGAINGNTVEPRENRRTAR